MPFGCSGIKNGCAAFAAHPNFDCSVVNACHGLQHLILLLVQALLHGKPFRNVDIDHLAGRAQITRLVLPSASALTA